MTGAHAYGHEGMPDAHVASQLSRRGGRPREDHRRIPRRVLRGFGVEGVSPEADLGRDEEPEGVARVVDERHAEAEDIQAALEGAQRPASLALRLLAAPTRGRRLRLERRRRRLGSCGLSSA